MTKHHDDGVEFVPAVGEPLPKTSHEAAIESYEWWWEKLDEDATYIYVVQAEPGTPIKIGIAKDPIARPSSLQTGNPAKLNLLYVVPGDQHMEVSLHRRLKDSSVRGEWFAEPGIDGFLAWMDKFTSDAKAQFEWNERLPELPEPRKPQRAEGSGPTGNSNSLLGHRWRTNPKTQAPMTVRFVKPTPTSPQERREALRRAENRRACGYAVTIPEVDDRG